LSTYMPELLVRGPKGSTFVMFVSDNLFTSQSI